jgi:hypothetical protein
MMKESLPEWLEPMPSLRVEAAIGVQAHVPEFPLDADKKDPARCPHERDFLLEQRRRLRVSSASGAHRYHPCMGLLLSSTESQPAPLFYSFHSFIKGGTPQELPDSLMEIIERGDKLANGALVPSRAKLRTFGRIALQARFMTSITQC